MQPFGFHFIFIKINTEESSTISILINFLFLYLALIKFHLHKASEPWRMISNWEVGAGGTHPEIDSTAERRRRLRFRRR